MKLSLSIIIEQLSIPIAQSKIAIISDRLIYPRPKFYTGGDFLDSNTLYISNAKSLPHTLQYAKSCALLCIGTPPENYFDYNMNLLVIDSSIDILGLSNQIHTIYDNYDSWESKLNQCMNEWNPLQYILDVSEEIFNNGLSIMDSNYNIVAETALNRIAYQELPDDKCLPIDQVNSFKNDKRYTEIAYVKDVFHFPAEVLPFPTLCKNIFTNENVFMFRIIITEITQKCKESDSLLLDYLSKYLEEIPTHINAYHYEENSNLTNVCKNIISGNSYDQSLLDKELKRLGWDLDNTYRIIYIQPSSQDIYNTTMYYFCSKIMREYKQTFAFITDTIIVVIVNISKIRIEKNVFFDNFKYFIREGNFRVGLSNYFDDLHHLKNFVTQARIALEIGLTQNPTIWSHKFSDNIFPYILSKITDELPAQHLYSPIIARIQRYDSDNQTEYLKTLKVYLENNMNAVQTAKDLFIHRATMIYRIDRIKEIGKTDLKNRDELLHLYLSLKLIDN